MYQVQIHHNNEIVKTFEADDDTKIVDYAYCWISGNYPGSVWHTMRYEGVRMFKFDLLAKTLVEYLPKLDYDKGKQVRYLTEYNIAPC